MEMLSDVSLDDLADEVMDIAKDLANLMEVDICDLLSRENPTKLRTEIAKGMVDVKNNFNDLVEYSNFSARTCCTCAWVLFYIESNYDT